MLKPVEDQMQDMNELEGVPEEMHEVVRTHGRALWVLVWNSNMAREALGEVGRMAEKHRSGTLQTAVRVLGDVWADCSASYAKAAGWEQEAVDACARDILLAMQRAPAGKGGIILLN